MSSIFTIIDDQQFNEKPTSAESAVLQTHMTIDSVREFSIQQIAELVGNKGQTCRPAICNSELRSWKSQQLFFLDFDSQGSIKPDHDKLIEIYTKAGLPPAFTYCTFSGTPDAPRFRFVFCIDRPIEDRSLAEAFQAYIMKLSGGLADPACKDLNRLFYGGKGVISCSRHIIDLHDICEMIMPYRPLHISFHGKTVEKSIAHADAITRLDVDGLKSLLENEKNEHNIRGYSLLYCTQKAASIVTDNNTQTWNQIQRIDICEFLGVGEGMFPCLFHSEKRPSAHIWKLENGRMLYYCFSEQCEGKALNLVSVVMKLSGCNLKEAVDFICSVYGIKQRVHEHLTDIVQALECQLCYISSESFQQEYPDLYRLIHQHMPLLQRLHREAIRNCSTVTINADGQHTFSASIRHMSKNLYKASSSIQRAMTMLTLAGLVWKVPKSQAAHHVRRNATIVENQRPINIFCIPEYTPTILNEAERILKRWRDVGGTLCGMSREYAVRTFGQEVADRLYPQSTGQKLSEVSDRNAKKYLRIVESLIESKGYVSEKDIISLLETRQDVIRYSKKLISYAAITLGLVKVYAGESTKTRFSIVSKGYPVIYIKRN